MILDLVIEAGNPADSDRLLPMLERHIDIYGQARGKQRRWRLRHAQQAGHGEGGVCDMAFHEKAGLRIEYMVKSK